MFETPASCCSAIVGDHLKVYFLSEVKKIWDRNANVFHCNHISTGNSHMHSLNLCMSVLLVNVHVDWIQLRMRCSG